MDELELEDEGLYWAQVEEEEVAYYNRLAEEYEFVDLLSQVSIERG